MEIDPSPEPQAATGEAPEPRRRPRPGIFLRLLRRWWVMGLLWMVVTVPIDYLIFVFNEPTYEAFSTVRIDPSQPELFAPSSGVYVEPRLVRPYLETQVNVITSDKVLEQAVANPQVVHLPFTRQSQDPKADLRRKLSVVIIDNAYMIRVALGLPDPNQAATIVNTVVEAYMVQNAIFNRSLNKNLQETLKVQLETLEHKLKETKNEMNKMVKEGRFKVGKPKLDPNTPGDDGDQAWQPAVSELTREQYAKLLDELLQCDIVLADALCRLSALKDVQERHKEELDRQLDARIADEFQKEPKVAAVVDQIVAAQEQLDKAGEAGPPESMPAAATAIKKKLGTLQERYAELWEARYDQIRERLVAEDRGTLSDANVHELEVAVETATRKKDALRRYAQEIVSRPKDPLYERILTHDVDVLLAKRDQVSRNLEQLKFEAEQDSFRIVLQDAASVPRIPSNNARERYMAYVPAVVFALIFCLFLGQEIKAERALRGIPNPSAQSQRSRGNSTA